MPGDVQAGALGAPYRAPERCVDLHVALLRCYEAACAVRRGRASDVQSVRQEGHREALLMLAEVRPMLVSLLFADAPPVREVPESLRPVMDEARAQAMAARRYLLPAVADALHLLLLDCEVQATAVCMANGMEPGAERREAYKQALDALHALAPRLIGLVVKPVGEGVAVAA